MSTDAPTPTPLSATAVDTSALPDDPTVLKQMIAELIRVLRQSRRDQEALQQRLDACCDASTAHVQSRSIPSSRCCFLRATRSLRRQRRCRRQSQRVSAARPIGRTVGVSRRARYGTKHAAMS